MSCENIILEKLNILLKDNNADYDIFTDEFSFKTAQDGAKHYGISLSETTPTLIIKTKDKYFSTIISGSSKISFNKLKIALGIKDINMANPQAVLSLTGAKIGEVSLINRDLITLIDKQVLKNTHCYGGCGIAKKTLKINTLDLIRITNAQILDFTEPRS